MLTNAVLSALMFTGGVRTYVESAYVSSTGVFLHPNPVVEQALDFEVSHPDYGRIRTTGWIFSDIAGSKRDKYRRMFSCYEGTLIYGYAHALDRERRWTLDTNGGILWDWLGGYKEYAGTPLAWYAFQSLKNPYLIPYWNFLRGFAACTHYTRIRFGVQHDWKATEKLTISPYADITWGDPTRFELTYGERPEQSFLGGAWMYSMVGFITQWYFCDNWYLWSRCRYMFVVDGQARRLMLDRTTSKRAADYPFFGMGVGFRF